MKRVREAGPSGAAANSSTPSGHDLFGAMTISTVPLVGAGRRQEVCSQAAPGRFSYKLTRSLLSDSLRHPETIEQRGHERLAHRAEADLPAGDTLAT